MRGRRAEVGLDHSARRLETLDDVDREGRRLIRQYLVGVEVLLDASSWT